MWKWLRSSGGAVLVAAACLTLQDVRNEGCKGYCVAHGHEGGFYVAARKQCACIDYEDYSTVNGEPLSLGVPGAQMGQPASDSSGYKFHYSPYPRSDD
jgi:hypothetical protein